MKIFFVSSQCSAVCCSEVACNSWSLPPSMVTAYTSIARADTNTQPRQEQNELVLDTCVCEIGAFEVVAGLEIDCECEGFLTELFQFLLTLVLVLPIVVLFMVEVDLLLAMLDSPTN